MGLLASLSDNVLQSSVDHYDNLFPPLRAVDSDIFEHRLFSFCFSTLPMYDFEKVMTIET